MSTRGVPVQDLPENQDESVAYLLDEVTGHKTPLAREKAVVEDEPKPKPPTRRGRKKSDATDDAPDADEANGEDGDADAPSEKAALSAREIGS